MHRVLIYLACVFTVPWTILNATALILSHPFSPRLARKFQRLWARGLCWCVGIRVVAKRLDRLPKDRAVVIAPNHESLFDILVLASLPIEFRWISKKEVGRVPFIGHSMRAMGTYFVARKGSATDLNTMREVEDGLRSGTSVIIFPEGTRTRTGELLPFKKGAFRTAQNAGVCIIPVALVGTFQIAPAGKLPATWGHRVKVSFGEPMPILENEPLESVMNRFRIELIQLLEETKTVV